MNIKIYLLVFCILHLNVSASCSDMMSKLLRSKKNSFTNSSEYKLRKKVKNLEDRINRLRNSSEHKEPAITLHVWRKIERLEHNIFNKHYSVNAREWETFFREYEISYILYKRYSTLVNDLSADASREDLKKLCKKYKYTEEFTSFIVKQYDEVGNSEVFKVILNDEIEKQLIHLGNDYYEYKLINQHLDKLLNSDYCNSKCKEELKLLTENIGAQSVNDQRAFPIFLKGESKPNLDELTEIIYDNPVSLITKLKREKNAELVNWLSTFLLQPEVIDNIVGYLYKSKRLGKTRAVKLFAAFYNYQARYLHFPKINTIVKNHNPDIDKSLSNLKSINTSVPQDELLVTFARRVDIITVKKWKLLKQRAKVSDVDFYERMVEAEDKADVRGDISSVHQRSFIGQIAQFLPASTPVFAYQQYVRHNNKKFDEEENDEKEGDKDKEVKIAIEHDGEIDKTLEEVVDVITHENQSRNPSSIELTIFEELSIFIKGLFY